MIIMIKKKIIKIKKSIDNNLSVVQQIILIYKIYSTKPYLIYVVKMMQIEKKELKSKLNTKNLFKKKLN